MRKIAHLFSSLVLAAAPVAAAQSSTLLDSDFESPSMVGWVLATAGPHAWTITSAGSCGASSTALAYQRTPSCDYAVGGPSSSSMSSPLFASSSTAIVVEFDYRLDLDASGDLPSVTLQSSGAPLILVADLSNLVNDGALHHLRVECSLPSAFTAYRLRFGLVHDAVGNLGRGLLFDNVLVREAPAFATFCDGVTACPCGNPGSALTGCANSTSSGAALRVDGSLSLALDDLRWVALELPANRSAVLIEGADSGLRLPFGAGRMCLNTPRRRAAHGVSDAWGAVEFTPSLGSLSGASVGSTHHFQVLYRDAAGPCGASVNLTNGVSVALEP